jgi:hypothetical protein
MAGVDQIAMSSPSPRRNAADRQSIVPPITEQQLRELAYPNPRQRRREKQLRGSARSRRRACGATCGGRSR